QASSPGRLGGASRSRDAITSKGRSGEAPTMSTQAIRGFGAYGLPLVGAVTIVLFVASLYAIFGYAPVEAQMGIVQKIFYFHVPSAYAMYIGFACSAVGSFGYLYKRRPAFDSLGV